MQVGRVLELVGHATLLDLIETFQGLQELCGLRHHANSSGQLQPVRRLLDLLEEVNTPLDYVLVDLDILLLAALLARTDCDVVVVQVSVQVVVINVLAGSG